jgi:hypothetical protein
MAHQVDLLRYEDRWWAIGDVMALDVDRYNAFIDDTRSAASSWSGTRQVLFSITKHAMRRSADEIGATPISFRREVLSDPASVID